jgi:hypothetical protein
MTLHRPRLLALAVGLTLVTIAGGSPAAAHEGEGVLVVESATPTATGRAYVVRLTWEDDGHAALDATITATPIDPAGAPGTPVPMAPVDEDGRYQAEVAMPVSGQWTVRFTSVTPESLVEVQESVAPVATTTTAPPAATTTAPPSTSATTITPGTATAPGDGGNDDDGGAGWLIAAAVAAAALAAGAFALMRSTRGPGDT